MEIPNPTLMPTDSKVLKKKMKHSEASPMGYTD